MTPVEVPPSVEIVVPAFEETTSTVGVSEDYNSAALEEFISKVTKNIPSPLVDKPSRPRRVDPILIDASPQLPLLRHMTSGEATAKPWTLSRPSSQHSEGWRS